ncbi:MAG: aminotransferase class III-fold pyridoxal phosphate-dependent enzyme, partial [Lentisphaeria bacterium]
MDRGEVLEIDKKHIWHPFTQMKEYEQKEPIIITRGEGIFLFDDLGNRYYDTISSWWVNALGHCNKRINSALVKQ